MFQKIVKYKPKKLIPGLLLRNHEACDPRQTYVAIPDIGHLKVNIYVYFGTETMIIEDWYSCAFTELFEDKFKKGKTYQLGYFIWQPTRSIRQLTIALQ